MKTEFVVAGLGLFACAGGLASFLGWAVDVQRLTDWFDNGISTQPNAAVAVCCAGAGLLFLTLGLRRVVAVLGVVVGLLGLTAFLQYVVGFNLDPLNTALMFGRTWGRGGVLSPGRMGPPGAFCWTLIGTALVLASGVLGRRPRRFVSTLGLVTLAIASLAVTGYLYGAQTFYSAPRSTVIALQTALFVAAISVGLIVHMSESGPMRLLRDDGPAGVIARRATPVIILISFVLGLLRLMAQRAGLVDLPTATAARTMIETALLLGLLTWMLITIRRHDATLREADRRKDEFLATLGHELRGPLAPLRNMLEILKRTGGDGPVQMQAHDTMHRQLTHLVRLVDDLIDVGRINHNKLALRKERVALAPLIRQALETCQPLADAAGLRIHVHLPAEPVVAYADPVRLTQIFGNILTNACNYTPGGGTIDVSVAQEGTEAVVTVRDSGIGIPADKLERIFEMFTQLAPAGQRSPGGLGIGLTLVKRLVAMHGGTVRAHSDGPGRGTEIVVRLPALLESAEQPVPSLDDDQLASLLEEHPPQHR